MSVDSCKEDLLKAESMLFTASGRICVIIDVQDDDLSLRLTELQRNMAGVIPGVGGRSHTRYGSLAVHTTRAYECAVGSGLHKIGMAMTKRMQLPVDSLTAISWNSI